MIQIGTTLVTEDLIEKDFVCNLNACKGACCVAGEYGAPLESWEAKNSKNYFRKYNRICEQKVSLLSKIKVAM